MASSTPASTLKNYFLTGAVPTQAQFAELIDSMQLKSVYLGPFANDADAATGGVAIGEAYKLTAGNDFGIPSPDEGTLKVRTA